MLRDDLFALLAQRLGQRDDLIPRMATEVQLLQSVTLEKNLWLPWFLLTGLESLSVTLGATSVAYPDDYLGEDEDSAVWLYDATAAQPLTQLRKMAYDDMLVKYPGTGTLKAYAIGSTGFLLAPAAQEACTLKHRYFAADTVLSTNIENQWLKHAPDVVIAELGAVMAKQHMQYMELAATFENDAKVAWDRLYKAHIARQEANIERVMEA
jgi:hypothetical protein